MKLNWLGKAFLGTAAVAAVGKVMEAVAGDDSPPDVEAEGFDEVVVEALASAYRQGDYAKFQRIYRRRRPWADNANVAETWRNFGEVLGG